MSLPSVTLRRLSSADVPLLRKLNVLFGEAFADTEIYAAEPPSDAYIEELLAKEHVIALVALSGEEVVGYDLAVAAKHRRQGIATALIMRLREIAARRGAWVIYVQADYEESVKECSTSTSESSNGKDSCCYCPGPQCPLLALSGLRLVHRTCPLSGVKRTSGLIRCLRPVVSDLVTLRLVQSAC